MDLFFWDQFYQFNRHKILHQMNKYFIWHDQPLNSADTVFIGETKKIPDVTGDIGIPDFNLIDPQGPDVNTGRQANGILEAGQVVLPDHWIVVSDKGAFTPLADDPPLLLQLRKSLADGDPADAKLLSDYWSTPRWEEKSCRKCRSFWLSRTGDALNRVLSTMPTRTRTWRGSTVAKVWGWSAPHWSNPAILVLLFLIGGFFPPPQPFFPHLQVNQSLHLRFFSLISNISKSYSRLASLVPTSRYIILFHFTVLQLVQFSPNLETG